VIRYVKQQASDEERERQILLKQKKGLLLSLFVFLIFLK